MLVPIVFIFLKYIKLEDNFREFSKRPDLKLSIRQYVEGKRQEYLDSVLKSGSTDQANLISPDIEEEGPSTESMLTKDENAINE